MFSSRGSSRLGTELVSLMSPALAGRFFTTSPQGKSQAEPLKLLVVVVVKEQFSFRFIAKLSDRYRDFSNPLR